MVMVMEGPGFCQQSSKFRRPNVQMKILAEELLAVELLVVELLAEELLAGGLRL